MTPIEILAKNLKRLRAQMNWSQEELASKSGVNLRTISRLETEALENPRSAVVDQLAATFGVESYKLFLPNGLPVDPNSLTDGGATLLFKKPKERKPPSHADAIRSAMKLLAESAPQNEDELLLLESFRQLDEMKQAWILFLVTGSEEKFQKWRALYQGEMQTEHLDSMAIMRLKNRHLPPKR